MKSHCDWNAVTKAVSDLNGKSVQMDLNSSEIPQAICSSIIAFVGFVGFLLMFSRAVLKGDFIFRFGRIRGRLARTIGVIGLLGMSAGVYLAISYLVFNTQPPFAPVAVFLFVLLVVVLLVVRFLSLFFWHSK